MHNDGYFDERVASTYDYDLEDSFSPEAVDPVVDFLAELAGSGSALEFGIGTGRIALPLSMKGVEVQGIDISQAMLAKLAQKTGGDRIFVTQGDFATTSCRRSFSLVYLIFNTIMNLTTQDEQVKCFQNAASHLKPGGNFVIEVMVPALQLVPYGETNHLFDLQDDHWGIDTYDVASQSLKSHHMRVRNQKMELSSTPFVNGSFFHPPHLAFSFKLAILAIRSSSDAQT
ncbi:MAG: methyltransferase domain-containing protein [Cyanobacteria bacterium P01_E01_bin.35]